MPRRADHTGEVFIDPDTTAVRSGWHVRQCLRYLAAVGLRYAAPIGCVLAPFVFLYIFEVAVATSHIGAMVIPDTAASGSNCVVAGQPSDLIALGVRASDVSGRYSFAISSAAMCIVSIIAVAFAFFVIFRRTPFVVGCVTSAASIAVGLLVAYTMKSDKHGTLATLVNPVIDVVQQAHLTQPGLKDYVAWTVTLNSWFGLTATVVLLCGLAIVAIRAYDEKLESVDLRHRLLDLRCSMALAASIPVMTVITTRALVDWQLGFLCEDYSDKLKPIGAALGNLWGVGSSGFLFAAFLPAYLSWSRDVTRWAAIAKPDGTERDRRSLIETECLDFAPSKSAITLLTIATPALSGPLFEALKGVLDKIR